MIAAGSSRACSRRVSRSLRSRSSSASGNVGRWTTSAMSGSASFEARDRHREPHRGVVERAVGRRAARRGTPSHRRARAPTFRRRPRPASPPSCCPTPYLPAGSAALPAVTIRLSCTIGTSCCSTSQTASPFESVCFWMGGSLSPGGGPGFGGVMRSGLLRGERGGDRDDQQTTRRGTCARGGSLFASPERRSARRVDPWAGTRSRPTAMSAALSAR